MAKIFWLIGVITLYVFLVVSCSLDTSPKQTNLDATQAVTGGQSGGIRKDKYGIKGVITMTSESSNDFTTPEPEANGSLEAAQPAINSQSDLASQDFLGAQKTTTVTTDSTNSTLTPDNSTLTPEPTANDASPRDTSIKLSAPVEPILQNIIVSFQWHSAFELLGNERYELIFWPVGTDPLKNGFSPIGARPETFVSVDLNQTLVSLPTLLQSGRDYLWGVLLVRIDPYERIKILGDGHQFRFELTTQPAQIPSTPIPVIEPTSTATVPPTPTPPRYPGPPPTPTSSTYPGP